MQQNILNQIINLFEYFKICKKIVLFIIIMIRKQFPTFAQPQQRPLLGEQSQNIGYGHLPDHVSQQPYSNNHQGFFPPPPAVRPQPIKSPYAAQPPLAQPSLAQPHPFIQPLPTLIVDFNSEAAQTQISNLKGSVFPAFSELANILMLRFNQIKNFKAMVRKGIVTTRIIHVALTIIGVGFFIWGVNLFYQSITWDDLFHNLFTIFIVWLIYAIFAITIVVVNYLQGKDSRRRIEAMTGINEYGRVPLYSLQDNMQDFGRKHQAILTVNTERSDLEAYGVRYVHYVRDRQNCFSLAIVENIFQLIPLRIV